MSKTCFLQELERVTRVSGQIWPEFELIRDFMPSLVTCKVDEDAIKNEGTIVS